MTNSDQQPSSKEKAREPQSPSLIAYHVSGRGKNAFWTRIGVAWKHDDGKGFSLKLDLVPTSTGWISLREPKADEEAGEESA